METVTGVMLELVCAPAGIPLSRLIFEPCGVAVTGGRPVTLLVEVEVEVDVEVLEACLCAANIA